MLNRLGQFATGFPVLLVAVLLFGCSRGPDPAPSGEQSFDVGPPPNVHGTWSVDCETNAVTITPSWPDQIMRDTASSPISQNVISCPVPAGSPPNMQCQQSTFKIELRFNFRSDANGQPQGEQSREVARFACPCKCTTQDEHATNECPSGQARDANGRCSNPCDRDFVPPRGVPRWLCP